jgi:hypothetical protein
MLLKEAIEVPHEVVAKNRRYRADLGGRECAEQVLREGEPDLYLELHHRLLEFGGKCPLEGSPLNSEFSCKSSEPQLHVSVGGKNEVMCKTRRAFKERSKGTAARRGSQCADLRDDIFLDRRELVCREAVHNCFLRTQGQRSTDGQSDRNCYLRAFGFRSFYNQ